MKCGLSMYSLVAPVRAGQLDLYGFLDYAARVGAEGVELLEMFWTDENSEIVEVKRRCAALGLMLPVYSISTNFFQPDAAARAQQLKSLCHGVDVAAQLGAGLLRVFSGDKIPGYSLEQGINWVVDSLAAGADYAASQGVTLALENHGHVAGRSEQVRGIIEAVSSPALRANLDTGNFLLVGQNPLQAASALVDLVALVHLKDFTYAAPDETGHVYQGLDGKATPARLSAKAWSTWQESTACLPGMATMAGSRWSMRATPSRWNTPCRAVWRQCTHCCSSDLRRRAAHSSGASMSTSWPK